MVLDRPKTARVLRERPIQRPAPGEKFAFEWRVRRSNHQGHAELLQAGRPPRLQLFCHRPEKIDRDRVGRRAWSAASFVDAGHLHQSAIVKKAALRQCTRRTYSRGVPALIGLLMG